MKKMFLYYIKRRLLSVLILLALFSVATIILLAQAEFVTYETLDNGNVNPVPGVTNMFLYLSIMLSVLVTIIPIFEFIFKMKRRSVDLYYSLPIKRIKLYLIKYLIGLVEILIIFIPQWLIAFIWTASVLNQYLMYYYWFYLLVAFALGVGMYTTLSLFFTMANNLLDGVLFMAMGSTFLAMIINIFYWVLLKFGAANDLLFMRNYFLYSPLFNYSQLLYLQMCNNFEAAADFNNVLALVLVLVLEVVSGFLFFYIHSTVNSAEKVNEDSNFILGYKVMLPIFLVTSFKLLGQLSALYAVLALIGYLAYCIYRRSFRIKKEDFVSLSVSIIVGLLIAIFL